MPHAYYIYRLCHLLRCTAKFKAIVFPDSRHMKVVRLSALCTDRLYPRKILLVLISVRCLIDPQDYSAAGRINSMKSLIGRTGNRNHGLPACGAVPQPTAPSRAPLLYGIILITYDEDENLWINLGISSRKWNSGITYRKLLSFVK